MQGTSEQQANGLSSTYFRDVVEALGEGVLVQDRLGVVLTANDAAARILGMPPGPYEGDNVSVTPVELFELDGSPVPADKRPGRHCIVAGEPSLGHVFGLRRSDGTARWIELDARPLFHAGATEAYAVVSTIRDVTTRLEAQRALAEAQQSIRFQALMLNAAGQAIVGTDHRGRVVYWNDAAAAMYGWLAADAMGRFITDVLPPYRSDEILVEMQQAIDAGQTWSGDVWVRRRDRSTIPVFMSTTPIYDDLGNFVAAVGVSTDITDRKRAERELARQALHDPLTELPNRTLLVTRLEELITKRRTVPGTSVVVLFIDLDRFKVINDGIGHEAGDAVLRAAADRLSDAFIDHFVARFGGDEFVVVCESSGRIDVDAMGQAILDLFAEPFNVNEYEMFVSASVGVAVASDSDTSETMLRDADAAMYCAKDAGRSRTAVFDDASRARASRRLQWETALRHALARSELWVAYQPVIDIGRLESDGSAGQRALTGFEALVRWDHPQHGLISPADFIPVAEDTGDIVAIGEWVLHRAVAQLAAWQRLFARPDLSLSVNLSARQLLAPSLVGAIAGAIGNAGIAPSSLHLELTETAVMRDIDRSIKSLHALKEMGVQLAVDDFGTGYSSLMYLKRLPIDVLKIDRTFVDGLGTDQHDSTITEAIVALGSAMDLTVIAEGVETALQRDSLRELGCRLGQGFLWSRPLAAGQLQSWVQARCPA